MPVQATTDPAVRLAFFLIYKHVTFEQITACLQAFGRAADIEPDYNEIILIQDEAMHGPELIPRVSGILDVTKTALEDALGWTPNVVFLCHAHQRTSVAELYTVMAGLRDDIKWRYAFAGSIEEAAGKVARDASELRTVLDALAGSDDQLTWIRDEFL